MNQRQRDAREFADWKLSDWLDYRQLMIDLVADQDDQIAAKQARIDELMLEYCPEEMTEAQTEEWARHQEPASGEMSRDIAAAIGQLDEARG